MNILVTGAAGFIASHLIEELLKDKDNIIIGIDNFYSGTKENIEFIEPINKNENFIFEEADIRDFDAMDRILKINKIEQIYHLAAIVSVQESIKNPIISHDVNVKGTLNILEASRRNNVKKIVFSSSAAVYGDEPILPKNEYSITKPISPYGCEKLVCEEYMKLYSDLYGLETVILRYFNVYGERQSSSSDYSGVISIFDNKFKNNEIPTIHGNGEQYRDFVYVKDIVYVNIKAMNTNNISGEVFCVGTAKKISINNLLYFMNKKYNKSFNAQYIKAREGDILESICDNSKIKNVLEIKSFKKFEKGVMEI